jgi:hypothetical protein
MTFEGGSTMIAIGSLAGNVSPSASSIMFSKWETAESGAPASFFYDDGAYSGGSTERPALLSSRSLAGSAVANP